MIARVITLKSKMVGENWEHIWWIGQVKMSIRPRNNRDWGQIQQAWNFSLRGRKRKREPIAWVNLTTCDWLEEEKIRNSTPQPYTTGHLSRKSNGSIHTPHVAPYNLLCHQKESNKIGVKMLYSQNYSCNCNLSLPMHLLCNAIVSTLFLWSEKVFNQLK